MQCQQNIKYYIIVLLLAGYLFSGCEQQHTFNVKQTKSSFITCLNNQDLKSRMFIETPYNLVKNWTLNGNIRIDDSLKIGDRCYRFKPRKLYIHSDSTILYKLIYTGKNSAYVKLEYEPQPSSKLVADCYFKYINGDWKLDRQTNSIICGKW